MNFIPYIGKIWFEPMKQESVILSDEENIVEAGKVLGIGEGVEFCKKGDTIFFLRYGAECTPEMDGKKYWTVADDSRFLMGKMANETSKKIEQCTCGENCIGRTECRYGT